MSQIILLAIALAMDAFAVSIGLGAKIASQNSTNNQNNVSFLASQTLKLALMAGVYFGTAQGVMPLIGYFFGSVLLGWLAAATPWIGCFILTVLGARMLYEAFSSVHNVEGDNLEGASDLAKLSHKTMFTLAIATSLDAMAAGFTLNVLPVNAGVACLLIAFITAMFGFFGVYLGVKSGIWLEDKAEIFGGVVLIVIGVNMVV